MASTINKFAGQIDSAIDAQDIDKIKDCITQCKDGVKDVPSAISFFFEANCYSALAIQKNTQPTDRLSWNQNERVSEILALRKAISDPTFLNLEAIWQCKILTNLGNVLSFLGRTCEAIRTWNEALKVLPNFAMAHGNKAEGFLGYGSCLYDHGHASLLANSALQSFMCATNSNALWDSIDAPHTRQIFNERAQTTKRDLDAVQFDFEFDLNQWPLGKTESEKKYRSWALKEGLFLSPLNDATNMSVAAQDVIHLPGHKYKLDEKPRFANYYNILKQEYVSARYMAFEALENIDKAHFSDNDVILMDGLDYAKFGLRMEQMKTAYRLAYSVFDKIALFLNDYFGVNLKVTAVNFRSIWGKEKKETYTLHPCFDKSQNWPLRGLYYLSKDFFDEEFRDISSPDAKELSCIRNRLEHRFLSLQDFTTSFNENTEEHTYLAFEDFAPKTFRVLRNAREAIIYLALAMHREEEIRDKRRPNTLQHFVPIHIHPIE